MVKYQEAKIYCIKSYQTEQIYVGSTCQPLSKRMAEHRSKYKFYLKGKTNYISSFEILKYGDAFIELIKKFPCEDRDELRKLEGYYIKKLDCVNKCVAGRTTKESDKAHYRKYKEIINQKQSTKLICMCGSTHTLTNKAHHIKTIKHRLYLLSLYNELNHLEL